MTQQGNGIAIRHSINEDTNKQNQTNNVMLCHLCTSTYYKFSTIL